jgi:hypothetical protein
MADSVSTGCKSRGLGPVSLGPMDELSILGGRDNQGLFSLVLMSVIIKLIIQW